MISRAGLSVALLLAVAPPGLASTAGIPPVEKLEAEELRRPNSSVAKRNLGIALLNSGRAEEAARKLEESRQLDARDPLTLYFLARAWENAGRGDAAIDAYAACAARGGRQAALARARLRELTLERLRTAVAQSVRRERQLDPDDLPTNTIVVPEFALTSSSDTLRPLARGLAVVMTTDLAKVPGLRVLERERLGVLAHELELAGARAMNVAPVRLDDPSRVGLLLGARNVAQGGLVALEASEIQLDAMLYDVSRQVAGQPGPPAIGKLPDVLGLEKALVFQVIDSLHVALTPEQRREIGRPPTKNFASFLAFSRGIDFEERGLPDQAIAAYREAARLDPAFTEAKERQQTLTVAAQDHVALEARMTQQALAPAGSADRLAQSGAELGLQPIPGPPGPELTPTGKTGTVRVVVTVPIPR